MRCLSVCEVAVGIFHCICWICSDSDLASISSLLASTLPPAARIHCCHPTSHHSNACTHICTHTHAHANAHSMQVLVYFWHVEIQLLSWNQIIVAGRCSSQMVVSVCCAHNNHTEDGGNVYRVTHLCTVACQIQDLCVHILSKTASKSEKHDANQMLCPRISKQSSLVYVQHF